MNVSIKDLIKDNFVYFEKYRQGVFYYKIQVITPNLDEDGHPGTSVEQYIFPVPLDDIGDATLPREEKAIMFMRYIRKAKDDGTLVKA